MSKHPAITQAQALGYREGDRIYIRAFAGKGFDVQKDQLYPFDGYLTVGSWGFTRFEWEKRGGGVKAVYAKGLEYLARQNAKGYGIYLIPNKGGRKDADITGITSLFFECDGEDDLPKDEQWDRIERLPIQPSLIVETRKSLHVYYTVTDGLVSDFRKDQQRLIQLMDSDRSIHNESRLMRLAGFDHQKAGKKPYPINIVFSSTKQYTRNDILQFLPEWDAQKWSDYKKAADPEEIEKRLKELRLRRDYVGSETFPLEICLTKKDRELLANGTEKGTIYNEGYKLACNLIATEEWLRMSGYNFSGSAEQLFIEFAIRSDSTKPLNHPAFQGALKSNPSPSLSPEAIENCINAWRYKQAKQGDIQQQKAYQETLEKKQNNRFFNNLIEKFADILKSAWKGRKIDTFKANGEKVNDIPEKVDYKGQVITFKSGEGAKLYELAGRKGYKYVLDISPTGSGKTHTVGALQPNNFFLYQEGEETHFSRIFYSAPSVRNPNSEVIENDYFEQTVRNDGYIEDHAKLTPSGKPFRSAIKKGQELTDTELRTQSNCDKTSIFTEAYANGHSTDGFCGACEHFEKCKSGLGKGSGYLSINKDFIHETKVRSHLKAIPKDIVDENTILILDEAEAAEWVAPLTITEKNINFTKRYFRKNNIELYYVLLPLFESLSELSDKENNSAPRYGWTMKDLLDKIEIPVGIADYLEAIKLLEKQARPSLEEIQNGATIHPLFLHPLLSVLLGKKRGSISGGNGALTLTLTNERALEMFSKSHINIFQDATYTPQQLALSLGIDESEILVLCQESKQVTNLNIKQYTGAGRMGGDRSQDEQKRVKLWREHFDNLPDPGYIEKKDYALPGDLIHGGDGRGSNAFLTKKNIVSIGVYSPNLGAVLNEYQALSGKVSSFDDPEFVEYYAHKVASNVLQEIGRARANRRENEQLTYHIVADCDLSFLEDLGYEVERIEAVTINPELSTIENRVKARNIDKAIAFVKEFGEDAWQKLTQQGFAKILGISQSALNQWVKKYVGKFWQFKELVLTLANPKPKPDSAYSEQDMEEIEAVKVIASIIATVKCTDKEFSQEIKGLVDCFQWKNILEGISRLSYSIGLRLLFRVIKFASSG